MENRIRVEVDRKATVWFRDIYYVDAPSKEEALKLIAPEVENPEYSENSIVSFYDSTPLLDTVEWISEEENQNNIVIEVEAYD